MKAAWNVRGHTLHGWLATASIILTSLALFGGTAVAAGQLLGSPVAGAVVANAVMFTAGMIWLRSRAGSGSKGVPVRTVPGRRFWALAGSALVMCWLVGQAGALWVYSYTGSPGFESHSQVKQAAPVLLTLLLVLVLAPMGEEMLMRGLAYARLRRHLPPVAAALLTAGVFSLLHQNLVQILATLPLGMLLAAVYERTGRLTPVIGMHIVFNLLSVALPVNAVSSLASLAFVLVAGSVLLVLLAALYAPQQARRRRGGVNPRRDEETALTGR
ncbi:CPBP family intramembrane glutamic endopeptidase [Arthrobacter koreensis]|uniref:CPBP family intramembrane glutamic endopeptidase n=1 Tax=Arthrobacter koreensis TaxID=199136 RepID=UPI003809947B